MGITSDIERAEAQIRNIVIEQIPFGVSKGVNDSLTEVRDNHIWGAYNRAFEARSYNFFRHTHAIFRSHKEQAKRTGRIIGYIQESGLPQPPGLSRAREERVPKLKGGGKPVKMGQVAEHIAGATRRPKKAKTLAVPAKGRKTPIRRMSSGAVAKSQRPSSLIGKPNIFVSGKKKKNGVRMIMQRTEAQARGAADRKRRRAAGQKVRKVEDKSRKVQSLFVLLPSVRIPAHYPVYQVGRAALNNVLPRNVARSLSHAIRTSRSLKRIGATASGNL